MYIAEPEWTPLPVHVAEIGTDGDFFIEVSFSTPKEALSFAKNAKKANPKAFAKVSFSADGKKKCPMPEKRFTNADFGTFRPCLPSDLKGLTVKAWHAEREWVGYLLDRSSRKALDERGIEWECFSGDEVLVFAWRQIR